MGWVIGRGGKRGLGLGEKEGRIEKSRLGLGEKIRRIRVERTNK